jgi:pyrroline-5-carboxylate reductase
MKLGLIGAGNMASALARGIGEPMLVSDIDAERASALAEALGGEAVGSNGELAERADAVVLCHKPKQLEEVAQDVAGRAQVVISILAATSTAQIGAAYPGVPIYRFIPNMPAEVRRGVLCYTPGPLAAEGPEQEILELFGRAGIVIRIAEAFVDAGVAHGLDREDASRMTLETMGGTSAYLAAHELDMADLRARVATPGGTTERGLIRLEDEGVRSVVRAAVDAVMEATVR